MSESSHDIYAYDFFSYRTERDVLICQVLEEH